MDHLQATDEILSFLVSPFKIATPATIGSFIGIG